MASSATLHRSAGRTQLLLCALSTGRHALVQQAAPECRVHHLQLVPTGTRRLRHRSGGTVDVVEMVRASVFAGRFVSYIRRVPLLVEPALCPGTMASLTQPEIAANEMTLRPWQASDRGAVTTAFADEAIRRWHCRSMTEQEAADWIESWSARWHAETDASWAVLDAGTVVGQVGLRRIDLVEGLAAVSYWVLPPSRGRRIAGRALSALSGWSFETLGLHRLELSHSTANPASCRVAQHTGFPAEGTKRSDARHADGWHDMHLHARLHSDV